MRRLKSLCLLLGMLWAFPAWPAEVIPPIPAQYFNDYAHAVSAATASDLNQKLEQFERDTSSQIVVAVYPKMQSDSSIEDYTVRVAQSWGVGQKDKSNGAVLFVFIQDHKMYIQVGYGLEGALPDALAKRILENELKPHFRAGNYDAGLRAGVTAILQAVKGEYKGTGHTVAERGDSDRIGVLVFGLLICVAIVVFCFVGGRSTVYTSGGWRDRRSSWISFGGGGFGGGGFGGGGGFSGGGGGFGGGGAGGSW